MKPKISPVQQRDTILAILLILLLSFYATRAEGVLYATFAVLVAGMTVPKLFTPAARIWFAFSGLLGHVMSQVIMGALFFLLVAPVGLIRKLLGKDAMLLLKWKKSTASVFITRDKSFTPEDLTTPY